MYFSSYSFVPPGHTTLTPTIFHLACITTDKYTYNMAQQTYDVLVKCIVIGDSYTGKSCILHRFTENKFLEDCTGTIGVEFGAKVVDVMNKSVKLQVYSISTLHEPIPSFL